MDPELIAAMRAEYTAPALDEASAGADPLALFRHWLAAAIDTGVSEPNAMALATATAAGRPSVRYVLLKALDERGLIFFTNYTSRKGAELAENPYAALVLFWHALHRQVRVEGAVEPVLAEESDRYFESRPRGAQIGAAASPQSEPVPDRSYLDERVAEVARRFPEQVARPAGWGGYLVRPEVWEFWQGRQDRLHDRFRFRLVDGQWARERLAP